MMIVIIYGKYLPRMCKLVNVRINIAFFGEKIVVRVIVVISTQTTSSEFELRRDYDFDRVSRIPNHFQS